MESELMIWTMVAIVGTVGVIKNLVGKGGKKIWTVVTLIVGTLIAIAAIKLPVSVLQVWAAVTGATLFYDTIFKTFQKSIEMFVSKIGTKDTGEGENGTEH